MHICLDVLAPHDRGFSLLNEEVDEDGIVQNVLQVRVRMRL